jgi:rRNA-processing protein FCF1
MNGKNYQKAHFALIQQIIARFGNTIYLTPHLLQEVYRLSKKNISARFEQYFAVVLTKLRDQQFQEFPVGLKTVILNGGAIVEFGFADMSLIEAAKLNKWTIVTDDQDLFRAFNKTAVMINFSGVVATEIQQVRMR